MEKSKSLKKTVFALLIFALIAFVVWAAFFIVFGLSKTDGGTLIIKDHFAQFIAMFNPTQLSGQYYLPLSIAVLSISGLAFIFLVLTLIFSIAKRRGIIVLPYILFLLSSAAAAEVVANYSTYTLANNSIPTGYLYFTTVNGVDMSAKIIAFAIIGAAGLALLLSLITWIFAVVHACKYPNRGKAKVEEEKEPTEVAAEPEDVSGFVEEPEPEENKPVAVVLEEEPAPVVEEEEVKEEPKEEEPAPVAEPESKGCDKDELISLLRCIVREELDAREAKAQPAPQAGNVNTNTVTGATFSAPLVVQYFNGMAPVAAQPAPQPEPKKEEPKEEPKPEPKPEPVKEEPAPAPVAEPVKEPEPAPVVEEPAPVVEEPAPVVEVPAPVVEEEKAKIVRIPFEERMVSADKEMQDNYNELKNEILSYGVKSRVSNSGDTFRLHRKTYVKLTIAGKSLKLYFALNPEDYKDSTIPVQDASEKNIYAEIPLVFKVKSALSMKRCKQLIADVMEKDGLEQGEIGKVNWVKEIKASLKEGKKAASSEDDD